MTRLMVAINPGQHEARILVMAPSERIVLKAKLLPLPRSRQALPLLLKGLALWQGRPVHAVLVADEKVPSSATSLFGELCDGVEDTKDALYVLQRVQGLRRPLLPDELVGMGRFADLARLLVREVGR